MPSVLELPRVVELLERAGRPLIQIGHQLPCMKALREADRWSSWTEVQFTSQKLKPRPTREATGDGEEGDVASRVSMRLANHNGSLEPINLYPRDVPVDWTLVQCGNVPVKN